MLLLRKYKWYVIALAIIWALAFIANHFSRNSFDYIRVVMRFISGTTIDINGQIVDVPEECYRTTAVQGKIRYAFACKNDSKDFLGIDISDAFEDEVASIRSNLADYPHADLRNEFIYFAWARAGEEFIGVIDHYLILPSMQLTVSGDDRDLVLRFAQEISDEEVEIDPVDFGL